MAALRPSLFWSKVWYFESFATSAVLYPLLNLYFRRIGLSETQIGVLAALRPWTSAVAGNLWAGLGDHTGAHKTILMFTYLGTIILRYCIGLGDTFLLVLGLVILTEAMSAPILILADASAMAAGKSEGEYGKARMWGAVGWGMFSPMAGVLVSRFGAHASFHANLLGGVLGLLPTALLPTNALQKKELKDEMGHPSEPQTPAGPGLQITHERADGRSSLPELEASDGHLCLASPQSIPAIGPTAGAEQDSPSMVSRTILASPFSAAVQLQHLSCELPFQEHFEEGVVQLTHAHMAEILKRGDSLLDEVSEMLPLVAAPELIDYDSHLLHLTQPSHPPSMTSSMPATPAMHGTTPRLSMAGEEEVAEIYSPEQLSIWQKLGLIFSQGEVVVFFIMTILMGFAAGTIDGYMFLYLDQLGAPEILMGLTITVACLVELPVFHYMGRIIKAVGVQEMLHWVMFFFLVRLGCYTMLGMFPSPWLVLPVETLNGITFGGGSVNFLWYKGLYMGLGLGLGGGASGWVYNNFGPQATFATAFAVILGGWCLCALVQQMLHFCAQRRGRPAAAGDVEKPLLD